MAPIEVVTNAGPLIYLALVSHQNLLNQFYNRIVLPQAVYQEVVIQGAGQPGSDETHAAVASSRYEVVTVSNHIAVEALLDELHVGEAEAIVSARELGIKRVLLDDGAARRKAKAMGLEVTGTIGILLLARQAGLPINLKYDIDLLIRNGFRLSRDLYNTLIATN